MRFCNYRERCTFEVEQKIRQLGFHEKTRKIVLDWLIDGEYFDDAVYAQSYAQGKFNIKHWGKLKIKAGLYEKRISSDLIKVALHSIDPNAYLLKAKELVEYKRSLDPVSTYEKLTRYLLQKGFEPEIAYQTLKDVKEILQDWNMAYKKQE